MIYSLLYLIGLPLINSELNTDSLLKTQLFCNYSEFSDTLNINCILVLHNLSNDTLYYPVRSGQYQSENILYNDENGPAFSMQKINQIEASNDPSYEIDTIYDILPNSYCLIMYNSIFFGSERYKAVSFYLDELILTDINYYNNLESSNKKVLQFMLSGVPSTNYVKQLHYKIKINYFNHLSIEQLNP